MNHYDFLVIYLTCGAPFAVYYFLQHRSVFNSKRLWLKTILTFLFWLPSAYRVLTGRLELKTNLKNLFVKKPLSDSNGEENLQVVQKRLEKIILEADEKISVYELREIFARYAGLMRASQDENKFGQAARYKIFEIGGHDSPALAEICFERRNRKRLFKHQTQARRDFLDVFSRLFESHSGAAQLGESAIEFVTLLNDSTAQNQLKEMIELRAQTSSASSVKNARKDLWKLERLKPSITSSDPNRLEILTVSATSTPTKLPAKD